MKSGFFRLLKIVRVSLLMFYVLTLTLFLPTNSNLFKLDSNSVSVRRIKKLSSDVAVLQNSVWQSLREDDETSALSFLNLLQEKHQAEVVTLKFEKVWRQQAITKWGEDYFIWHPNECYGVLAKEALAKVKDAVRKVAARCGFDESEITKISTAAYELAGNIYLYAGEGAVIIREIENSSGNKGIEIVGIDKGKGISEEDMQTTVANEMARWGWGIGSTGYGIGLMKQYMDFHLYSQVDGNMIVLKKYNVMKLK